MPNSPSTSFIPKQGPARQSRQAVSRQVHLLTVFSYLLFFSTLIASVGVFFYSRHVESQKQESIQMLGTAVGNFSDIDMQRVHDFNIRINQAEQRFARSVSVVSVLDALEEATVKSIEITDLRIAREADERFLLHASAHADTFDSSLFQRGVFERNQVVESVKVEGLTLGSVTDESGEDVRSGVSFTAIIGVPLNRVPYQPETGAVSQTQVDTPVVVETATSTPVNAPTDTPPPSASTTDNQTTL